MLDGGFHSLARFIQKSSYSLSQETRSYDRPSPCGVGLDEEGGEKLEKCSEDHVCSNP